MSFHVVSRNGTHYMFRALVVNPRETFTDVTSPEARLWRSFGGFSDQTSPRTSTGGLSRSLQMVPWWTSTESSHPSPFSLDCRRPICFDSYEFAERISQTVLGITWSLFTMRRYFAVSTLSQAAVELLCLLWQDVATSYN